MNRLDVDKNKVTPMMAQYLEIKEQNEDIILFFRLGDFYEMFFEDAILVSHELELTWLRDWEKDHYDLGDNEIHLAFTTDNMEAAHQKHEKMGCICYENPQMGIYFINDPDGYWLEIVPEK